ncbi:MAG: cation-translocating P-type ATPase [Anaerolineaceae bacterium]
MTDTTPASYSDTSDSHRINWHAIDLEQVVKHLGASSESGLSTQEAQARQTIYGLNQLTEGKRPSLLQLIINQLKSFVVILLIAASLISAALGDWVEAAAILAIVLLNALLGVIQERKAEEALAALKKLAQPEAQVIRDGHRVSIPAEQLVPGDVVYLEAGHYIPADLRLLEAINLKIEEAALTGESLAVQKNAAVVLENDIPLGDRKNTAFMGTLVSYGRGCGLVTSTGMHTQLGLIATMLQAVEDEETPLQKRLDQLGKTLGWACLAICGLVFVVGLLQGGNPLELFMVAVSLAIAAVPEGLPAIVTISLALGMREMVRRHALIRRLASVETLGSATIICTDKTGTLTQNEMTVTRLWVDDTYIDVTGSGYQPRGEFLVDNRPANLQNLQAARTALWLGALNNDSRLELKIEEGSEPVYRIIGDPTEGSLLVAAAKAGAVHQVVNTAYPREDEIPFDSDRKRMVTVHRIAEPDPEDISPFTDRSQADWQVVAVKGAPDIVLDLCSRVQLRNGMDLIPMDQSRREKILEANNTLTQSALRVLAVAYQLVDPSKAHPQKEDLEKDLVFVGLIGMIDPARSEVKPAMEKAATAGIRTIMITGDYSNTARAIGESIGLLTRGHRVVSGTDLNAMDDATLSREINEIDVFARVSPEHKMRIVDALRNNGEIVAMTGDGVNDAPAIKLSDIGVAMGITGTDVAKESADMVLTDDNYASIVSAVEQGRIIYSNIRKFVYFLVSCNLAEIAIIFLPTLFGRGSPLQPIQLLWLNLITDGAPALALGTEKGDPDIMNQPPRPPREPIINKYMQMGVVVQTIAITAATLLAFELGKAHAEPQYAETMAFMTLAGSELIRAFTARSERYPLLKIGIFTNRWMNLAVLASFILLLAVIYIPFLNPIFDTIPLGWAEWEIILPLLLIPSITAEIMKTFTWLSQRRKQKST